MQVGVLAFVKFVKRRLIPVSELKALIDHLSDQGASE